MLRAAQAGGTRALVNVNKTRNLLLLPKNKGEMGPRFSPKTFFMRRTFIKVAQL